MVPTTLHPSHTLRNLGTAIAKTRPTRNRFALFRSGKNLHNARVRHERPHGIIPHTRPNLCLHRNHHHTGGRCLRHGVENRFGRIGTHSAVDDSLGAYARPSSRCLARTSVGAMADSRFDAPGTSHHDSRPADHMAPIDCGRTRSAPRVRCSSLIASLHFEIPCRSTEQTNQMNPKSRAGRGFPLSRC